MANAKFDLQTHHRIRWLHVCGGLGRIRVELTCHLCRVKQIELIIPLKLTGGTLASETVDVFFAALKKLEFLFGGLPERTLVYAFVAGLPERVKQLLRASTSIEVTPIEQLLEFARAIARDETELT